MSRELLRISMNETQVKDACREFAEARSNVSEPCTVTVLLILTDDNGIDDRLRAEIVFTKKRNRKPTKEKPQ